MAISKEKYAVIIAGGGSGSRFGEDKQFFSYKDIPIIIKTTRKFQNNCDQLIVVTSNIEKIKMYSEKHNLTVDNYVASGAQRIDSIRNGLAVVRDDINFVMVHDGARPNVSEDLISELKSEVVSKKAVIPVITVKDTIKVVKESIVESTPERSNLYAVQTPQIFSRELLQKAYDTNYSATDDAGLVEQLGERVYAIAGEESNIKITTKEDLRYLD